MKWVLSLAILSLAREALRLSAGRGDGVAATRHRSDGVEAIPASSSSFLALRQHIARESASFMRQPPLKVVTGSFIIFCEKPTLPIIAATSSLVEPQAWMRLRAVASVAPSHERKFGRGVATGR